MRVLVTGASGQLGPYLLRELQSRKRSVVGWSGASAGEVQGTPVWPVDLGDRDALATAFRSLHPDIVLHAGAMARLSDCHRDPERAWRVNVDGSAVLAELTAETGARLLLVSTDLVFDGEKGYYHETDLATPLSVYGRTKRAAEKPVLATPRGMVARVSLLFGPSLNGRSSFFTEQVDALRTGRPITLFADEWRTPLALSATARALVELAESDCTGLLHLGGPERLSRLEMGQRLAAYLGVTGNIRPALREAVDSPEPRPRDTSLDSSRWRSLFPTASWPSWQESLAEMLSP